MGLALTRRAIIDSGPLVAFLDRNEAHHKWAVEQVKELVPPLLVCEAVLTESLYLLRRSQAAQKSVFELLDRRALLIKFSLNDNRSEVQSLLSRYFDRPISLADACIVRMAELNQNHFVFTLDSDFAVYRAHGKERIDLIAPQL